ncbi:PREDICTED: uncharacterized protein LOC104782985 [Camelina sativa]|uniref:Uncharacterized protein LOC104782985 n=1 Tax=Camelina sativa TaxID=90675 RepID=A0ABM0YV78_CAMSA|nr:PREDICTED: uncharacterized protein LOC104782985 [Camelina sativa]
MASRKPANRPAVRHMSHNHPLHVFKARDKDEISCSGCNLDLTGQAFKCTKSECDYFLHKSCFDLPRETNHKSHPKHSLTLLHSPPNGQFYTCHACGEYGSGFVYNCAECQYDVHVGCVFLAETVKGEDHEHPLILLYNTPCKGNDDGAMFICDVCEVYMSGNLWVYYCKECDYGTHVHACAVYEDNEPKERRGKGEGEESSTAAIVESFMKAQYEILKTLHLEACINKFSSV